MFRQNKDKLFNDSGITHGIKVDEKQKGLLWIQSNENPECDVTGAIIIQASSAGFANGNFACIELNGFQV